jgi:hypothetical protein
MLRSSNASESWGLELEEPDEELQSVKEIRASKGWARLSHHRPMAGGESVEIRNSGERVLTSQYAYVGGMMRQDPQPAAEAPVCYVRDAAIIGVVEGEILERGEDGDLTLNFLRVVQEVFVLRSEHYLPRAFDLS